jgi:hypothetical protein
MNFGLMGISRDVLLHAYGADCVLESGKMIIVGKSIETFSNSSGEAVDIPWKSVGWLHNKLIIKEFKLVLDILSPSTANTHIVAHIDFNAPVPTWVVNYLVTKVAGLFLFFFQKQARTVVENATCEHAERIRSNATFYRDWVLPKIR